MDGPDFSEQQKGGEWLSVWLLAALLFVLVLFVAALNARGQLHVGYLLRWAPSLFVLLGLWGAASRRPQSKTGPLWMAVGAGLVQLGMLGGFRGDVIMRWWPIVFVLLGLAMLLPLHRMAGRWSAAFNLASDGPATVGLLAALAAAKHRPEAKAFEGGRLSIFMGGAELDLRAATKTELPALLRVTVVLGRADILVPPEWEVYLGVDSFLGGSRDSRIAPPVRKRGLPHLIVIGTALFGNVIVRE